MSTTMERMQESGPSSQREGGLALPIEKLTAQLPSDTFLWLAMASIGGSLTLRLMGRRDASLFVGQWAPTFLILGVYNKIVKVSGHDRMDRQESSSL